MEFEKASVKVSLNAEEVEILQSAAKIIEKLTAKKYEYISLNNNSHDYHFFSNEELIDVYNDLLLIANDNYVIYLKNE